MAGRREGHADLRVVKTRETIREAFRGMVCEMPAEKITVKGIADRARIHRKTFYLHYTSIEALYEDMLAPLRPPAASGAGHRERVPRGILAGYV